MPGMKNRYFTLQFTNYFQKNKYIIRILLYFKIFDILLK